MEWRVYAAIFQILLQAIGYRDCYFGSYTVCLLDIMAVLDRLEQYITTSTSEESYGHLGGVIYNYVY
jgi:hypothetical protein